MKKLLKELDKLESILSKGGTLSLQQQKRHGELYDELYS